MQPLQAYMLPACHARAVAALRSTNKTYKCLLDNASGQSWASAMHPVLPREVIQYAADGTAMQKLLRAQVSILKNLGSADVPCRMHSFSTMYKASLGDVHWSPEWPSRYIAVVMSVKPASRQLWEDSVPPSDFEPALFLDTSTWTALSGFKPSWSRSYGIQDKWHAASCTGHSPCNLVFACCALGQALEVAYVMNGELDSQTLPQCYQARALSPQCISLLCTAPGNAQLVWLVDVPSLTVRGRVSPELLDGKPGFTNAACQPTMQPYWMEWEPASGRSIAITWRSGSVDAALSFHDAANGNLHACFDLQEHLSPALATSPLGYTWSPSGRFVLAHGWGFRRDGNGRLLANSQYPQAVIFGIDGSCSKADVDACSWHFDMAWFPCGRYLYLTSVSEDTSHCFQAGFIWDAIQRAYVHIWKDSWPDLEQKHVIWPAPTTRPIQRTGCLIMGPQAEGTLLLLPSPSGSSEAEQLPMQPHRKMSGRPSCTVSACSKLLVWKSKTDLSGYCRNCMLLTNISGAHAFINWGARRFSGNWQFSSIAWHPCPATRLLYAIANDGTVCLMDGHQHKCLRSWSLLDLDFAKDLDPLDYVWPTALHWSPCGSQLAVLTSGLITFLCFH